MKTAEQIGNEPAFPFTEHNGDGSHYADHVGMTMRQYYKAAIIQGLMAAQIHGFNDRPANGLFAKMAALLADMAARFADAMLAEDEEHAKRVSQ